MKTEDLKTGLFGFRKASVFQYISEIEEECSAKLMERDAQIKKNEEQYLLRTQQLEEELSDLKEALEKQKGVRKTADAQRGGASAAQEQEAQRLGELLEKKRQELKACETQIQHIRETLQTLLSEMNGQVQELRPGAEEEHPTRNMSLFLRKNESVE